MKRINTIKGLLLASLMGVLPVMAQSGGGSTQEIQLLPAVIGQRADMSVFAKLLQETGWIDSLLRIEDVDYVPVSALPDNRPSTIPNSAMVPPRKPIAYTVFAETDSVFSAHGISDAATLTAYLKEQYAADKMFAGLLYNEQYTNRQHAANYFVSYHLLGQKLNPQQLVYHYNEIGFDKNEYIRTGVAVPTVPVYDYYVTKGTPRRLLKVYESPESQGVRLNRMVTLKQDEYQEESVRQEGLSVSKERMGVASNGNVYFLKDLLVYDEQTVSGLASERLRMDMASLSPELMNLGYRRIMSDSASVVYLTPDFLENIKVLAGDLYYLSGFNSSWSDYQGDELLLATKDGDLDILIALPPVPASGMYQVRLGVSGNPDRSVVQYYLGEENAVKAMGLSVDERTDYNSSGYKEYGLRDSSFVDMDLLLAQGGHMRAPAVFTDYRSNVRDNLDVGRRIVGTIFMDPSKQYYLRVKSVIKSEMQQFLDYIELVPSEVYDNPNKPEDIW